MKRWISIKTVMTNYYWNFYLFFFYPSTPVLNTKKTTMSCGRFLVLKVHQKCLKVMGQISLADCTFSTCMRCQGMLGCTTHTVVSQSYTTWRLIQAWFREQKATSKQPEVVVGKLLSFLYGSLWLQASCSLFHFARPCCSGLVIKMICLWGSSVFLCFFYTWLD